MSLARRWMRREHRRVHEPDDRARVRRELLDGQLLLAGLVLAQDLDLEALGGLLENALRALALLENRLNRRRRADAPDGVASCTPTSSIIGRSLGSDTTITSV